MINVLNILKIKIKEKISYFKMYCIYNTSIISEQIHNMLCETFYQTHLG